MQRATASDRIIAPASTTVGVGWRMEGIKWTLHSVLYSRD